MLDLDAKTLIVERKRAMKIIMRDKASLLKFADPKLLQVIQNRITHNLSFVAEIDLHFAEARKHGPPESNAA